jgi:hypothetical protein
VNQNGSNAGDRARATSLAIDVTATSPPGEASGRTLSPLLVESYDHETGEIHVSYAPACASAGHNVYWGLLSEVSAHAWSGETCDIGSSGSASFAPGDDSYFFVVVGHDAEGHEGSYGLTSWLGEEEELPPHTANGCGVVQVLGSTCDD